MKIANPELDELVYQTARERFGFGSFQRRELMNYVEERLRKDGLWTSEDEPMSKSVSPKSRGAAAIDWAISRLGNEHRFFNLAYNLWAVPVTSLSVPKPAGGTARNGTAGSEDAKAARLQRLRSIRGCISAPSLSDEAFSRENLY